jgi:hypothetical protein
LCSSVRLTFRVSGLAPGAVLLPPAETGRAPCDSHNYDLVFLSEDPRVAVMHALSMGLVDRARQGPNLYSAIPDGPAEGLRRGAGRRGR